jgi:hypothetical protein
MSTLSDEQIEETWTRVVYGDPLGVASPRIRIAFARAVIEADRAVREKGASPAPALPAPIFLTDSEVLALYVDAGWDADNRRYLTAEDAHILADRLRRFAALAPSPAGEREPEPGDEGVTYPPYVKRVHPAAQPAAPSSSGSHEEGV